MFLLLAITLVLRSGDRLVVDGAIKEAKGAITFRSGGTLYKLPKEEVARIEEDKPAAAPAKAAAKKAGPAARLKVSEEEKKRLLEELENNHAGVAAAPKAARADEKPADSKEEQPAAAKPDDEASWNARARVLQDAVDSARRQLAEVEEQAKAAQRKIVSLIAQGYGPESFTYDQQQFEQARAAIPVAREALDKAEQAYAQFRERMPRKW